jgi:hypothetical protein
MKNVDIVRRKFNFYINWYERMSDEERLDEIGRWVLNNLNIYTEVLTIYSPSFLKHAA